MNTIAYDTHAAVKRLISNGASETLAEAMIAEISPSRTESESGLVTENYLKKELAELKSEMLKWYVSIAMFQTFAFLGGIVTFAKLLSH